MIDRHIGDYHFMANPDTGMTLRWGKTYEDNPNFAPIPELADISISNHCTKGCIFCYRNSTVNNEFLSVEDYCYVLDSMCHPEHGNVFQVALGGGEPLEHPDFLEIIEETCRRSIVPNVTTNGEHLTSEICKALKGKVGAVALSITDIISIPQDKVALLINQGIKINLHYVISDKNIKQATEIACGFHNDSFSQINAIIFLTYKPAGRAKIDNVLKQGDTLNSFIESIKSDKIKRPKIGFDACFIPMLLRANAVKPEFVDVCEGGFFSVYIDHNMNVSPCSFSGKQDCYNLKQFDFYDIWFNKLHSYRDGQKNNCSLKDCQAKELCRGCCPYYPIITQCYVSQD